LIDWRHTVGTNAFFLECRLTVVAMVTIHGCYGYYVLLPWLLVVPTLQPCDDGEMVFIIMTDVRETYDGSKLEMTTFYPQNRLSPYFIN